MSGFFIFRNHKKEMYSTICGKEFYPVVTSPLEVRNSCIHELNITHHKYSHVSEQSKYYFKDVLIPKTRFVSLEVY